MACFSLTSSPGVVQFEDKHHSSLLKVVADQLKCSPSDIVDFELNVCDTQDGVIGGETSDLLALLTHLWSCMVSVLCTDLTPQMLRHVVLFSREWFMHLGTQTH